MSAPDLSRRRLLAAALGLAAVGPLAAQDAFYLEGANYTPINPPVPTTAPEGKVEVVELFWYGCPHCYMLEPHVEAWRKTIPEHVHFVRMAAVLNPPWVTHARAYFAAELLGVVDTVHEPIFKAIHEERRPLRDENALARFVADLGVDEAKFRQAFNSFEVHTLLRRSAQLSAAYQVRGVPAMIVDGRYSTSASLAGGHPEVLQVVDYLVEQRRSAG